MIPVPVIMAILGAAVGAGKTAANPETRKDWKSYIGNTVGGAASGYGAGSPGPFLAQQAASYGGFSDSPQRITAQTPGSDTLGNVIYGSQGDRPTLNAGIQRDGESYKTKIISEILKSFANNGKSATRIGQGVQINQLPGVQPSPYNPINFGPPLSYPVFDFEGGGGRWPM